MYVLILYVTSPCIMGINSTFGRLNNNNAEFEIISYLLLLCINYELIIITLFIIFVYNSLKTEWKNLKLIKG